MNKRFLFLVILMQLLFFSTQSQNPVLLRASFDLYNGDNVSAIDRIQGIQAPPDEQIAYYNLLARAAWRANQYDLAENAWKTLLAIGYTTNVRLNLAKVCFVTGRIEDGFNWLRLYLKQDDRQSAKEIQADVAFEQVSGTRSWVRFWSGDWYTDKEDRLDEARAELDRDFPSEPIIKDLLNDFADDRRAWLIGAQYFEKTGNSRKAIEMYQRVLTKDSGVPVILQLANLYTRQGQQDQALSLLNNFLRKDPYHAEVWMKCVSLESTDQSAKSGQHLQYLKNLGIQNRQLILSAVREDLESQPIQALRQLNGLISENPMDKTALNLRARLFVQEDRLDEAMTDYTQSLDIDPFQDQVYFDRAEIRSQLGDHEGACHDWKKALQYGNRKAFNRLSQNCDF